MQNYHTVVVVIVSTSNLHPISIICPSFTNEHTTNTPLLSNSANSPFAPPGGEFAHNFNV